MARRYAGEVRWDDFGIDDHTVGYGKLVGGVDRAAGVTIFQFFSSQDHFAELALHFGLRAVQLHVGLHRYGALLEVQIALLAWQVLTADLLVLFDLIERVNLETIRVALAADFGQLKYLGELWAQCDRDKLVARLCLLAVAAFTASLLPLLDARFTIDGALAHRAVNRSFLLR